MNASGPEGGMSDLYLAHLRRLGKCSRCARGAHEKCLDCGLQGEEDVQLHQVTCGCGCWSRVIFEPHLFEDI